MGRNRYGIAPYYRCRTEYVHFDDTGMEDEWQLEVYLAARDRMISDHLTSVIDVGCGSGYKLVRYLGQFDITGVELAQTLAFLRDTYPERRWIEAAEFGRDAHHMAADVVICSDVIEHVVDPDRFVDLLKAIDFKYLYISTPDRRLAYKFLGRTGLGFLRRGFWGPPGNPTHQREWTYAEFSRYLGRHFDVIEHRITNRPQATQMCVCRRPAG